MKSILVSALLLAGAQSFAGTCTVEAYFDDIPADSPQTVRVKANSIEECEGDYQIRSLKVGNNAPIPGYNLVYKRIGKVKIILNKNDSRDNRVELTKTTTAKNYKPKRQFDLRD